MDKDITDYEREGYEGTDASLDISLFEYGLIWAKGLPGHEKDYHFIYGVRHDIGGEYYDRFDWGDVPIDCDVLKEWNWIDIDAVLSFVGMNREEWLALPLPMIVFDLISYYGVENIFGDLYSSFQITNREVSNG